MKAIRKVALFVVGAVVVLVAVIWFATSSHAAEVSMNNAPTVDDWTGLVTREDGLTKEGCDRFFPKLAGMQLCLARWNAQKSPEQKLLLLQEEGHPVALRVFQTSRNDEYRQLITFIAQQEHLPDEAVREMKETTYGPPALDKCLTIGTFGADQCVLMTGVLVPLTSEELEEFQDPAEKLFLLGSGCSDIACRAAMHQMYGPRTYINPNPPVMPRATARPLSKFGRQSLNNMRFPRK